MPTAVFLQYRGINKLFMHALNIEQLFIVVLIVLLLGCIVTGYCYYPFPNSTTQFRAELHKVRLARTFLIKIGHIPLMGHNLLPNGIFLTKCFISIIFYASLYTRKYIVLKL